MAHRRSLPIIGSILGLSVLCACGDSGGNRVAVTFDSDFSAWSSDYDPAPTLAALAERSAVVAEARLVGVVDGPIYGDPSDEIASRHINLVFETGRGNVYYVQLPRSPFDTVEQIAEIMPIGASNIIYLQPNIDPLEGWSNYRDDGNEWFFTTPQGWFLDHPARGLINPLEPINDLGISPPVAKDVLSSWLPPGLEKDPGLAGDQQRPATVAEAIARDAPSSTSSGSP